MVNLYVALNGLKFQTMFGKELCWIKSHNNWWCNELLTYWFIFLNRCPQSEAYERRQDPNGMYMKHLLKHVMNDTKVEDVLHQVAGGMDLLVYKWNTSNKEFKKSNTVFFLGSSVFGFDKRKCLCWLRVTSRLMKHSTWSKGPIWLVLQTPNEYTCIAISSQPIRIL